MARDAKEGSSRSAARIPNSLLALGSAAVIVVYSAGNLQTLEAARQFDEDGGARRRPAPPAVSKSGEDRMVSAAPIVPPAADSQGRATATVADAHGLDGQASVASNQPSGNPAPKVTAAPTGAANPAPSSDGVAQAVVVETVTAAKQQPVDAAPIKHEAAKTDSAAGDSTASKASTGSNVSTEKAASVAADSSAAKPLWRDGTYSGWGTSRHGNIEATVVIERGRITSATISRCMTRYSCSWIEHLQQQVVTRQSADVDYVSGATQSANAFYYAVLEALQKAQ